MRRKPLLAIIAFAVALVFLPAVATATEEPSIAQELADRLQALTVQAKLVDQLGVDALRISVQVSGKSAFLTGTVPKQAIRDRAPDVALTVKGITIVKNDINVTPGPGTVEAAESEVKDTALEIKVKSVLLTELGRNAMDINVDVDDGIVTLRGTVDSPQVSQLAFQASSKVKGVKMVVNTLRL